MKDDNYSLYNTLLSYSEEFIDPVRSAIILDLCRGVTLPQFDVEQALLGAWNKEVVLAETRSNDGRIHWKSLFDPQFHHIPVHRDIPANRTMASHIHSALKTWSRRVEGMMLFSRSTHKNMSRDTRRNCTLDMKMDLENVPVFGQDDWIRIYHDTGLEIEGASEMRQRWYPANAKPRTYFSQGGSAYKSARFLQDIFGHLLDELPPTHRIMKLLPSRLNVPFNEMDDGRYKIYDLSSFTSNLTEIRPFVQELANFCSGITVTVVDERWGPTSSDLGDLLWAYHDDCVMEPTLSYERFTKDISLPTSHARASMLGIFGNMALSTFTHFAIVSQVVDSLEEINIAGDDAVLFERWDRIWESDTLIRSVGDYSLDKTFDASEEAAICLKRPITIVDGRLFQGISIIPPTLSSCLAYLGIEDPRYTFYDLDSLTVHQRISTVGKDLLRFLRSSFRAQYSDVEFLSSICRNFARLVRDLTGITVLPSCTYNNDPYVWPFLPDNYEFLDVDPAEFLAYYRYRGSYVYTLSGLPEVMSSELLVAGDGAEGPLDKRLSLLEKLGYISKEEIEVVAEGTEGMRRLLSWIRGTSSRDLPCYRFSVNKDVPMALVF